MWKYRYLFCFVLFFVVDVNNEYDEPVELN